MQYTYQYSRMKGIEDNGEALLAAAPRWPASHLDRMTQPCKQADRPINVHPPRNRITSWSLRRAAQQITTTAKNAPLETSWIFPLGVYHKLVLLAVVLPKIEVEAL